MEEKTHQSYSWWFNSHQRSIGSPWLISSLTELENKTVKMMKLIEVEGDSFTKRVEIYYKTRPQLILLIEDLYRSHRSLIEQYDWARNQNFDDKLTGSPSSSSGSNSSEVVDPPIEESTPESGVSDVNCDEVDDKNEVITMKEEIERLRMENARPKDELMNTKGGKRNWWMISVLRFFKLCR